MKEGWELNAIENSKYSRWEIVGDVVTPIEMVEIMTQISQSKTTVNDLIIIN